MGLPRYQPPHLVTHPDVGEHAGVWGAGIESLERVSGVQTKPPMTMWKMVRRERTRCPIAAIARS